MDTREFQLSNDELSGEELDAVSGGVSNDAPRPQPSPADRIIQWILSQIK
jgi:hypothetical protein